MTITAAKWTIEDYHRMIDAGILDDRAVELLNGEIVEMSPEGTPHAHLIDALPPTALRYGREIPGSQTLN